MARWVRETSRVERTRTREPAGETQSTVRSRTPRRMSRVRSCATSRPWRRSNGSSSTSSRSTLPLVMLITVWPDSG